MVDGQLSQNLVGQKLGIYELQAPIGAGGMGVVYRALDTSLSRPVAVKFLFEADASDESRRRFRREAESASLLNHPHIVTVHAVGELEGRQYLVTEYVDGGTLRDWIDTTKHGWRESLERLIGVADGLAAAHEAGILHRDIKPENILVTKSGYAKLADFGLAKLRERPSAQSVITETQTRPGVIMGTVAYMSPEQVTSQPVDARSDLFSFGTVLYEALSGRRPFVGSSDVDTLVAVAHREPPPLPETLPSAVRSLVETCLQKDPADRFQSMRDLVAELRRVVRLDDITASGTTRPQRTLILPIAGVAIAGVLAFALWMTSSRNEEPAASVVYTPLTSFADAATQPNVSPDGRLLTFIRGESTTGGPGQVYVKLLPDGEAVPLTNDPHIKSDPTFSPDGAQIAYTTSVDGITLDTWIVPALGGSPRHFLKNASGLTWVQEPGLPQGSPPSVLFSEFTGTGFQMSIVSSTESRSELRTVYQPPVTGMAHRSYLSPDRRNVLVIEMGGPSWLPCRLVPFDGSSAGRTVGPTPAQCTGAAWSPDGNWMYFSADNGDGFHIWRQRHPVGIPEQVTFGVTEEEGIHFAPDGGSFVTSIGNRQSTVWVHTPTGDRQVTAEGFAFFPAISPDGKAVFYLVRTGSTKSFLRGTLWKTELASGRRQALLPGIKMQHYDISVDGQRVLFVAADDQGSSPLWLATLDGRMPPKPVTMMNTGLAFFADSNAVVFAAEEDGSYFLFRSNEDGSARRKITTTPQLFPFSVSPDGRWVAAAEGPKPETRDVVQLYPMDGSSPRFVCRCYPPPRIDNGPEPAQLSWSPDGRFLYVKMEGSTYAVRLAPGQSLPSLPASGIPSRQALSALPGASLVSRDVIFPGPDPTSYAFMRVSTHRNIYRVPVK
jgi:eukaryotic-like serine/threonine-protein kinase